MTNTEIKQFIAERIAQGISLSKIQDALLAEKKIKMTFMELRMLASELETADWGKLDKPEVKPAAPAEPAAVDASPEEPEDAEEVPMEDSPAPEAAPAEGGEKKIRGKTVVELGKVAMPGAVANGSVQFGSGAKAEWYLDQTGRLGLSKLEGGQPDEQDAREFQTELRKLLGM